MRLEDKVTIITGAGGGMGRKAATMFAAEGARVVCVDVSEEMAESAAEDVRNAGGEATSVAADVSNEDEARRMVDHALTTFGRVDVLFNVAGIQDQMIPAVELKEHVCDRVFDINVRGTAFVIVAPGAIALTRIPRSATSKAIWRVKLDTAPFDAA